MQKNWHLVVYLKYADTSLKHSWDKIVSLQNSPCFDVLGFWLSEISGLRFGVPTLRLSEKCARLSIEYKIELRLQLL